MKIILALWEGGKGGGQKNRNRGAGSEKQEQERQVNTQRENLIDL
jgi:hypothetical protein